MTNMERRRLEAECGRYIADDIGYDVKKDYPFCNCGADMRGEEDE